MTATAHPHPPVAPLGRGDIARRIPHAGSMCLLDRVIAVDGERIVCATASHRRAGNPLVARDRLDAVHAIEYAAQAMALHRSFDGHAPLRPARGMLASVRAVRCCAARLDTVDGELSVAATRVSGDGNVVVYAFEVRGDGRELVSGRIAAVLDASRASPGER